ncbi:glucose-1-phosphate cytidylyltransferase [[Phormidium] sp. ETS-05]|uniref:glucose-1-phosphate cytidylyltransferase n=1 Tax=[Phormidium] sp. ETS-05 TaxID=222819 RepID=UPI0018EF30F5|nr:glucose-1-phosphate cytidylyltransferase [[Phormidium] sp. ETS-05]
MRVVILAGGLGTRLAEQTEVKPKPMVEIGERPILWHIMKCYAHYGFKEFFIALGYKGEVIKSYFLSYYTLNGSMSVNLATGEVQAQEKTVEDWLVHLMDTGLSTLTGGRVKRLRPWLHQETFMVTYGDGVSNINLRDLLEFHRRSGCMATVTAVRPPARYGGLIFDGDLVAEFTEKPQIGEGWINGGFLVFEPEIFDYLEGDDTSLEADLLERLARDRQLAAYRHHGFWQCMDTLRDLHRLETLWGTGNPPWKLWA